MTQWIEINYLFILKLEISIENGNFLFVVKVSEYFLRSAYDLIIFSKAKFISFNFA